MKSTRTASRMEVSERMREMEHKDTGLIAAQQAAFDLIVKGLGSLWPLANAEVVEPPAEVHLTLGLPVVPG